MSATPKDQALQAAGAALIYSAAGKSAAEANRGAAAAVVPVPPATSAESANKLQAANLATNDPKQIDETLRTTLLGIIREEIAREIDALGRLFGSSMYSVECYLTKDANSMSVGKPKTSTMIANANLKKEIDATSAELGAQYRKLTDKSPLKDLESFREKYIAFNEQILGNVNGGYGLRLYHERILNVNTQEYQGLKDKMLSKTKEQVTYS